MSLDREAFNKFCEAVDRCFQPIGNKQLAFDVVKLRAIIQETPNIAARFVEVSCAAAYAQPGLIKLPYVVATVLNSDHSMPGPLALVEETAKQIGDTEALSKIYFGTDVSQFRIEGPERDAARQWWDSVDLETTSCDRCEHELRRGRGFSIPSLAGSGNGFDLACEACFHLHLGAKRT